LDIRIIAQCCFAPKLRQLELRSFPWTHASRKPGLAKVPIGHQKGPEAADPGPKTDYPFINPAPVNWTRGQ
jgi:hypothetical protein